MAKEGKRYRAVASRVTEGQYGPEEALRLVRETATAKFDETVEAAVRLGVDPRHADQMVRGAVTLPHGTGKTRRVLVFAKGERAREAEEAGADVVGAEDVVARIEGGWLDFDVAIAAPDMMAVVGKLGRILGPKGLMPNPKSGTVTGEVATAVREFKGGKIEYRVDKTGIVHAPIGRVSYNDDRLLANFATLMGALLRSKPNGAKGQYVRTVTVSSTMGPGVPVHPQRAVEVAEQQA